MSHWHMAGAIAKVLKPLGTIQPLMMGTTPTCIGSSPIKGRLHHRVKASLSNPYGSGGYSLPRACISISTLLAQTVH